MSSDNILHQKRDNKCRNIISLGSSLNLELILSLEEKQYESLSINYKGITKLEDLKNFCPKSSLEMEKLTSLIELNSNNYLFNSILFINQSSKIKFPIKYLIPFSPKFPKELTFIYDIIKSISEKNHIYIQEYNILNIKPNIAFTLKLIENDITIDEKSFLVTNESNYSIKNNLKIDENKNQEEEYNFDLYKELNFEYSCDLFYTTIFDLFNCRKYSEYEVILFIQNLIIKNVKTKICINFDDNYLSINKDFIQKIISNTDIFIFDKKDIINFYFDLFKQADNEVSNEYNLLTNNDNILESFFVNRIKTTKINQQMKLGIFINDMKEIYLIQQEPKSNLIVFELSHKLELISSNKDQYEQKKYQELIKSDYNSLKSVYIGAFLNRLIRPESVEKCLKASLKCTIKYLEIKKLGLDVPTVHNYYELKAKRNNKKIKVNNMEKIMEKKIKKLENKFVLDCTNLNNKIKTYNSLYDENCISFFKSKEIRKHLQRQGFINKKGMILVDPKKNNEKINSLSKKEKKKILEKIQQKVNIMKETKRNNDNLKEKLNQISSLNQESIQHLSYKDFEVMYHENNKNNIKHFYLPTLNNKYRYKSPAFPNKFIDGENNKEDLIKNNLKLNRQKKYLSSINFSNKKPLGPIKHNNKINLYGFSTVNPH